MRKQENPAKAFLRRYAAISGRVDALQQAINRAMERAYNTGVTLKDVKVLSSPAEHDPMAKDVCEAVDACELLYEEKQKADKALRDILSAIDSLSDERQKELLTRRYITGQSFSEIMESIHYEKTQMYVIHGRALAGVCRWLKVNGGIQ